MVGLELIEDGIARHGHDVYDLSGGATRVGTVTSGTRTPFLQKAVAMAYVTLEHAAQGAEVDIDIRGRRTRARVVTLPFYKRA
jgi:aminomethyltransferase